MGEGMGEVGKSFVHDKWTGVETRVASPSALLPRGCMCTTCFR